MFHIQINSKLFCWEIIIKSSPFSGSWPFHHITRCVGPFADGVFPVVMEMQMFFFHYWVVYGYKFGSQTQSSKQAYDKIYEVATLTPQYYTSTSTAQ